MLTLTQRRGYGSLTIDSYSTLWAGFGRSGLADGLGFGVFHKINETSKASSLPEIISHPMCSSICYNKSNDSEFCVVQY